MHPLQLLLPELQLVGLSALNQWKHDIAVVLPLISLIIDKTVTLRAVETSTFSILRHMRALLKTC